MLIVPQADALTVEAKIAPQDIDQVRRARRRCCASRPSTSAPRRSSTASVSRVSADITADQRTGASYYTVRISIPDEQMARLGGLKLVPGMPVEAFIQTGERTVLSYLTKPLTDQAARSFKGR